jgi:hypothetical protein
METIAHPNIEEASNAEALRRLRKPIDMAGMFIYVRVCLNPVQNVRVLPQSMLRVQALQ